MKKTDEPEVLWEFCAESTQLLFFLVLNPLITLGGVYVFRNVADKVLVFSGVSIVLSIVDLAISRIAAAGSVSWIPKIIAMPAYAFCCTAISVSSALLAIACFPKIDQLWLCVAIVVTTAVLFLGTYRKMLGN